MAVFNATNEYVLYYHSGRKTIRAFRRKDGTMIANFRVQADLKGMETTGDGRSVVLGMGDGSMTTLTIADPDKTDIAQYLKSLPSRNPENVMVKLHTFILIFCFSVIWWCEIFTKRQFHLSSKRG